MNWVRQTSAARDSVTVAKDMAAILVATLAWFAPVAQAQETAPAADTQQEQETADTPQRKAQWRNTQGQGNSVAPPAESGSANSSDADAAPGASAGDQNSSPTAPAVAPATQVVTIPVKTNEPKEPAAEGVSVLEDIVVTATKREESVRDIPASVSAFDGAALENQGKVDLSDYLQESPGVVANLSAPGIMRINIRGIQTDTDPLSPAPAPVGIFIGDTPFSDPYFVNITPDLNAFDLQSVEVLKGPQGTLFGGAALSGAIRYVLQEPVFGVWQARGFSQYVSAAEGGHALTSGAALNVPVLEDQDLAVRLGFIERSYPGVYDDARAGQRDVDHASGQQKRAVLAWSPTLDAKLKLTHLDQDYDAPNDLKIADRRDGPRQSEQRVLPWTNRHRFVLDSLDASYEFSNLRLVSVSSLVQKKWYFNGDYTAPIYGNPPPYFPDSQKVFLFLDDYARNFSQELRLQSLGEGPFRWLVGGYYFTHRLAFQLLLDTIGNQQSTGSNHESSLLYAENQAKAEERAVFFDVGYKWQQLELAAGTRLYTTSVAGGFTGTGALYRGTNNGQQVDLRNRIVERGLSPRLAGTYHFTDDVSAYVSASRGFRFGGIQQIPSSSTVPATYKSDSLWNYELGLRTRWLQDTLELDLTGFYIQYQDPQIVQQDPATKLKYFDNVSAAISRGAEASAQWNTPLKGLLLRLAGGFTDAHITKPFTAVGGTVVKPGAQMPGSARTQYSAFAEYLLPMQTLDLRGHAGYVFTGKGYGDIVHSQPINDFGTFEAGISAITEAWGFRPRLSLNVVNLLDRTGAVGGSSVPTSAGGTYTTFSLNPPRTISARLSVDY